MRRWRADRLADVSLHRAAHPAHWHQALPPFGDGCCRRQPTASSSAIEVQLEQACLLKDSTDGTQKGGLKLLIEARRTPVSQEHRISRSLAGWRPASRAWTGWASTSPRETFWWAAHLAWQWRGPKYKEMQRRRRGTDRAPLSMRSESCADRWHATPLTRAPALGPRSARSLSWPTTAELWLRVAPAVGLQVPSARQEAPPCGDLSCLVFARALLRLVSECISRAGLASFSAY